MKFYKMAPGRCAGEEGCIMQRVGLKAGGGLGTIVLNKGISDSHHGPEDAAYATRVIADHRKETH